MSVVANNSNGSGIRLLRGIKHGLLLPTGEGGATTRSTSARGHGNAESRPSSTHSNTSNNAAHFPVQINRADLTNEIQIYVL